MRRVCTEVSVDCCVGYGPLSVTSLTLLGGLVIPGVFDVRGKPLGQATHWSDPEVFGSRAFFRTVSEPAVLRLEDVHLRDEGVYRCRVDFRNTPTRSAKFNLSVIVLPERPQLLDRWGRSLGSTLGPLLEGDPLILTCRVQGGKPEPRVRWLLDGEVLDEECEKNAGDVIENRLTFRAVARSDLGAAFTCQATNTRLAEPREATIRLDLHLRPLEVRLTERPDQLEAGQRYKVACESTGSRPPAVITWYKGNRPLKRFREETLDNSTLSELIFVPSTEDDGKVLTCRAENPNITGAYLETSWTLSVLFAPIVSLRLGPTLNPDDIKEGDDVYFECHVRANPPWRRLSWLHDDAPLSHNQSAHVIHSNQSLVLQKVSRQGAGRYVCVAANEQGEAASNELDFRVKYAPTCQQERIMVVGASRSETLDIACHVDADPPARAFRWKFNNSGETMEVSAERFSSNGSESVLRYTVQSDLDYGSLSCWADNAVGVQQAPCVFQVVAAGKPFPVRNCSLSNQTASSVEVWCQAGFDGGLPQTFVLELFSGSAPRYNLTAADAPVFLLADLEPEVTFRVAVFAVNAKGRSPAVLIEEITFRDAERRTASEGVSMSLPPLLGAVAGAALSLLAAALLVAVRLRRSSRHCTAGSDQLVVRRVSPPARPTPPSSGSPAPGQPLWPQPRTSSPLMTSPTEQATSSASSESGGAPRPRDLRLSRHSPPPQPTTPAPDLELNGHAIKERLMTSRIPESCV
ncbi:hemicentin-2-like [Schistocerca cancellata]|uniref:hemicentin-2-like n=1 Tax=Schistocerca cancellata TaxID=274614 RepID=UPI002118E392|nr:hemicentin-2-like [Schistocerca cancellata]